MKKTLLIFSLLSFFLTFSQINTHVLNKKNPDQIQIDGIITDKEIEESKVFNIDNEISPGYNIPS
ncbi:MAG: hypothetical protein CMC30_02450, partial [Flavobacteriaceae bacterium]|nr:hypothetical protein [Flavobacteriaceae bacterium]